MNILELEEDLISLEDQLSQFEGINRAENKEEIQKIESKQIELIKKGLNDLSRIDREKFINRWYWDIKILRFEEVYDFINVDYDFILNRRNLFIRSFERFDMNTNKYSWL